jgi:diguanylate cyclase (GGDEF)-like protein/PAS domain S-box-containing protein
MPKNPTSEQLDADNQELRARLEKAEATLSEILSGEGDALFVAGVGGAQLFTLKGVDQSYRILIENMSEGAVTLTPDGLVLYANRRFAGIVKTPLEKVIGSEIYHWFAPESRQVIQALLQKEAIDNYHVELNLAAADGTHIPVYLSVSRFHLDGIPDSICMVATDLTEQKHTEAILAAEERSNAILDQAADAIVICDKAGRIMRASKQAQALYGKNPIGQLFYQAFPLRQPDGTAFPSVDAIDTISGLSMEARLDCQGQECDLLVSVGHLKGTLDELLGSVITLTDITERKQAVEHLKLFRALLDNSSDSIEVLDPVTMRILDVNETQCRALGYSREELLSMKITDIDPALNAGLLEVIDEQIRNTGVARFETKHRRKDGSDFPVEVSAKLVVLDKPYALNIVRDITEHRLAENKLRESEEKFRAIFDHARDGIIVMDIEEHLVKFANVSMEQMLGYGPGELAGLPMLRLHPPEALAQVTKQFDRDTRGGPSYVQDMPMRTKDGRVLYADLSGSTVEIGNKPYQLGVFRDATERKQAEIELRLRTAFFEALVKTSEDGILVVDSNGKKILQNHRFNDLLSIPEDIAVNPDDSPQLQFVINRVVDAKQFGDKVRDLYAHPEETSQDEVALKNGTILDRYSAPVLDSHGHSYGRIWTFHDITERKKTEARIKYLSRVHTVLSGINTLIVRVQDRDELFREACRIVVENGGFRMSMVVIVNPGTKKVVSIASAGKDEELLNIIKNRLSSSDDISNTMIGMAINGKQPIVSNDSLNDPRLVFGKQYAESEVRSMVILPLIVSNEVVGTISLYAREIEFFHEEEMKLLTELAGDIAFAIDHIGKQEKLNYLAYYDVLTGLANRTLFLERVAQYLRSATSGGNRLAIGLIDLERFKNINDSLGRTVGDALLKQVAEWLTYKSGDASLLARIDADHFAVVLPEVRQDGDLAWLVEKTMEAFLQHPFLLNDSVFRISVRVGIALFPDDGADAETLFRNAEAALKKAKSSGDRYLFYTQKMTEAVAGKLTLENQLRQAIDNEEFVLHYQPKVNLVSGKVTSAEALIRWNDPRTGLVPPGKFIPILEETGLIYEVGRWALRKSIEDYLRWRAAGLPAVRIAVNVSPLQLRSHDFVAEIGREIGTDAHVADGLELEITESLIMADVKHSIKSLQAIRAMGITIAIDDFGTGFSSLNYLAKLPVDTLKIDRSFVIEMDAPEGLSLVSTIIMVAHALKLKVVAEGVETEKQSRQLLSLNCDEMQGFLFSKPVPVEIFEARFLAQLPGE